MLLITAARLIHLPGLTLNADEVWSVWQTFGTPGDVLRWTPADWTPLYFLSLWGWKDFVGITPEALRLSSVLVSLLGAACFYRVSRRLWNERAALFSMLAYGALGFDVFLSLLLRGYIFALALTPLALWLTIRYFDHSTRRSAVLLALCLTVMFFIHFTSAFVFIFLGIYTLLVYRRAVWRWYLPISLSLPLVGLEVLSKWNTFTTRTGYNATLSLPPLPQALYWLFSTFTGPVFILWAGLFIVASSVFIWRRHFELSVVLLWIWMGTPILIYLLQKRLGLFQDSRYLWWVIPGFIWFIGWGLSHLSLWGRRAATLGLVAAMFWPGLIDSYQPVIYHSTIDLDQNLKILSEELHPGDGVLVDKNNLCGPNEAWDYFLRLYFPNGLPFITQPDGYQRVWYISADWLDDPITKQSLLRQHIPAEFFGPSTCLFRLYESPPNITGIGFENGLRFHGSELAGMPIPNGQIFHAGETLHLRLWWSIDYALGLDYSIGVYVITSQGLAQVNGPPQVTNDPRETSQWQTDRYYVEERDLTLPYPLQDGTYTLDLAVYQWWNNKRISAPGVNADTLLPLQTIIVHSW